MLSVEAVDDAEGKFFPLPAMYGEFFLADAAVHPSRRYIITDGFLLCVLIVAGCMQQTF